MMRRVILLAVVLAATAVPVHGYSHFGTGVGTTRLHWATMPIRWFETDRSVPGVSSAEFRTAVERAFKTWEDAPTASIQFVFGGMTSLEPDQDDSLSVLGFQNHPEMDRVLAATSFVFDEDTGEFIEADIFFNSFFEWSTAVGGDAARFDLESVAVHEIGHLLGLGHSAIGETELRPEGGRRVLGSGAVMFPISIGRGAIADRVLQPDDIAGISDLYPQGNFEDTTGGVHGRVRRGNAAIIGAHVVVFNLRTRALVGGFSLGNDGEFQVLGLEPGPYVLRVEPLDDADIDSFFDLDSIDIDFQVTYHPRLVVAPSGGVGDSVTVTVRPK
jgi:matrixin